jgi:phosphoenolpyruvate carboxylase
MVEQNAAVQHQRITEAEHGLAAMQALWGQCLQQLQERNLSDRQIAAALSRIRVELVLTAPPTEAKRSIVLEHHRNLYLLLVKRENHMWTPYEQRGIREEIKTLLTLLWRTGEIFLQKPKSLQSGEISFTTCTRFFPTCCTSWISGYNRRGHILASILS